MFTDYFIENNKLQNHLSNQLINMERGGFVYLLTNKNNTVIYTGVTSNLKNRVWQHRNKVFDGSFTCRYNVSKLVYFEFFLNIEEAIAREKQIKSGSRRKKVMLINKTNPNWEDLYESLIG